MNTTMFRQRLARNFSMFREVLFKEGLFPCLECVARNIGVHVLGMNDIGHPRVNLALFRMTDGYYDFIHQVDTGGVIDLPEMQGRGRNYVGTPARAWKLIMKHLAIDPSRFAYVDFGCGKGRTLLLASAMGYRRIIGVDISPQLLAVARRNMLRKKVEAELFCSDVREFEFPAEPLVLFMYNPFFPDVMCEVAQNIKSSVRSHPREVYVVYYSAAFREVWTNLAFPIFREGRFTYPDYAIYSAEGFQPAPCEPASPLKDADGGQAPGTASQFMAEAAGPRDWDGAALAASLGGDREARARS